MNAYRERAWKSWRHNDGEKCFGGGWFIVGIDTPEGSFTYHFHDEYWDMFACEVPPRGKEWDGHTEKDVTRLLSLPANLAPVMYGDWIWTEIGPEDYEQFWRCSCCKDKNYYEANFCPNCGAKMKVTVT